MRSLTSVDPYVLDQASTSFDAGALDFIVALLPPKRDPVSIVLNIVEGDFFFTPSMRKNGVTS